MSKEVSQVFGGIGDAVSGVLKGVGDAVDGAVKGVGTLAKQIYDSDVGKAIIIAGAIYFGGAALAGGFGTMGTSASFLSGMGAGVTSAAGSLTSAWGFASAGEFGSAASTLGGSWGTAYGAGAQLAAPVVETTALLSSAQNPMTAQYPSAAAAPTAAAPAAATPAVTSSAPGVLNPAAAELYTPVAQTAAGAGAPAATQPWYSQAIDYVTPKSELAKYGLISGATQLAGGLIQGAGQEQAAKDEREAQAAALKAQQDLRNANMAGVLWEPSQYAAAPAAVTAAPTGFYKRYMPQSDVAGSRFAQAYAGLPPGQGLVRSVMG
jgi:hypothetical protein